MKKIVTVSALLLSSVILSSCGATDSGENSPETEITTTSAPETTTTTATTTSAPETTTTTTTEEETTTETEAEPEKTSAWYIMYARDDWGEENKDAPMLFSDFEGKFSNSATSGSLLTGNIRFDNDNIVAFMLDEYGSHSVIGNSDDKYTITVIDESDNVIESEGFLLNNYLIYGNISKVKDVDGRKKYLDELVELFTNNDVLKVKIVEDTKYGVASQYTFKIDCTGFEEEYKKAFGST